MNLASVLHQMMQDSMSAAQLTDLKVGTVAAVDPLEITINAAMAPLQAGVLYLTAAVVERKIPILTHFHEIPAGTLSHNHSGEVGQDLSSVYQTGSSLVSQGASGTQEENIVCYENGQPLPVEDGYIILNRGLQVGDKVLLLRVQQGQRFVVLSRVMEVS